MKICAIICEYNPFHSGHKYLIERAKALSGCEKVLCIMSGNFTQRGEATVLPKFVRAEHAVRGGADCVIQLPVLFSVAPAEVFARGAVSILKSIPAVKCITFGCEDDNAEKITRAADVLLEGGENFTKALKSGLTGDESYKRSLAAALDSCGADGKLALSPNGTLAIEYARAIKFAGADIEILPVKRVGAGYHDEELKDGFSSASAIRANLNSDRLSGNVSPYVLQALKGTDAQHADEIYDCIAGYAVTRADESELAKIYGCSEGLEHKLKAAPPRAADIIAAATGKRYTSARIRRILTANMLGLYSEAAEAAIRGGTYIKPLAVRSDAKDEIFAELAKAALPVVIKKMSVKQLDGRPAAMESYERDRTADRVRAIIYGEPEEYEYTVKLI